jgi:hypothetical protein
MVRRFLLGVSLAVAGGLTMGMGDAPEAQAGVSTCYNPVDYGASTADTIGDSNRVAFQAMVDDMEVHGGGEACIPSGVFRLSRHATLPASLDLDGSVDIWLHGQGPATVLMQKGTSSADWNLLHIRGSASRITISDLALDGSEATAGGINTNLVGIGTVTGTIATVTLQRLQLRTAIGDCLRLAGGANVAVSGVQVVDSSFNGCARNAITMRRGFANGILARNVINGAATQTGSAIAAENTGGGGVVQRLVIAGNLVTHASTSEAISLKGTSTLLLQQASLTNNAVIGGTVRGEWVATLRIAGNLIVGGSGPLANLYVARTVEDLEISDNLVRRSAPSPAADLILITKGGSGDDHPERVAVSGNTLIQETGYRVTQLESISQLSATRNRILYRGGTNGVTKYGISVRTASHDADLVQVSGNQIVATQGTLAAGIGLTADGSTAIDVASVTNNVVRGAPLGLTCAGSGSFLGSVLVTGNWFDTSLHGIDCAAATTNPNAGTP